MFVGAVHSCRADEAYGRGALLALSQVDGNRAVDIRLWKGKDAVNQGAIHENLCIAAESNESAYLVVAPFDAKTNEIPKGWNPLGLKIDKWTPQYVPEINPGNELHWSFSERLQELEIYVAFVHLDDPKLPEIVQLLEGFRQNATSPAVRNQQVARLRSQILNWAGANDSSSRRVIQEQWNAGARRVAGVLADVLDNFDWRTDAKLHARADFRVGRPAVLLFQAHRFPAVPTPSGANSKKR